MRCDFRLLRQPVGLKSQCFVICFIIYFEVTAAVYEDLRKDAAIDVLLGKPKAEDTPQSMPEGGESDVTTPAPGSN